MRGEERSRSLLGSDLSSRDASFAGFFLPFFYSSLSLFLLPLPAHSISLSSLSRKPSRPRPASDVFHQINSRSTREYALHSAAPCVCIISFIIQLALNSTLFRGRDRSLRPSSSFSLRTLLLGGHSAPPLARAARYRHESTFAAYSHRSLILSAVPVSIFARKSSDRVGFRRFRLAILASSTNPSRIDARTGITRDS